MSRYNRSGHRGPMRWRTRSIVGAGWRRALPEVDVSPLEVLSRVTRLARHLDRQRTVVFARHDLETWTFDVLSALREPIGPPICLRDSCSPRHWSPRAP